MLFIEYFFLFSGMPCVLDEVCVHRKRKPIILIPPVTSMGGTGFLAALLTRYNVIDLLENGNFISPQAAKERAARGERWTKRERESIAFVGSYKGSNPKPQALWEVCGGTKTAEGTASMQRFWGRRASRLGIGDWVILLSSSRAEDLRTVPWLTCSIQEG